MKNFFKSFLAFGLATSIQKLLGFVLLPIYTRYFNTTEYGIIDMVGTVLAVFTIFGLLQLETSLQRYYYEYVGVKRKMLISNIYMLILAFSLMIGLVLFILAPFISLELFKTREYAILIKLISIQLPFINLSMLGLVLLRFQRENLKFLIVIVANVISSLLLVYVFVIYFKFGLRGVFFAQLGAIIFSTTLVTFYIREQFILKYSHFFSVSNLKYALPQFPARVGSMVIGQANRFFMLGYLSLGAIGIYSISMKLASSIQLVNTAFILAWAPFMHAQFKNKNNKVVFAKVFPLVVGVTFLCVCLITLFSQEMVSLLATPKFYSAYKYVGGLTLFFSLYIIKEIVDIGPKIREKTKYLSLTFFLSVIVNLTSLAILVKFYKLEGVIISMIITNLVLVVISWIVSNKLYYIPFSIVKFIIFIIPPLALSIIIMYFEVNLLVRCTISILCILMYGIMLRGALSNFKKVSIDL